MLTAVCVRVIGLRVGRERMGTECGNCETFVGKFRC